LGSEVGNFDLAGRTVLVPEMSRSGSRLIVATLRGFGVNAQVMGTYDGLHLGKRFTSGKECFPCQVTLGDAIHHLESEKQRLGDSFKAENYLYCMAEAEGPCRFGMYAKLHRIVLDSLDSLSSVGIASVTSADSYSVGGTLNPELRSRLRKTAFVAIAIGDALDRMLWRTRPYEREPGQAEAHYEHALATMSSVIEAHGCNKGYAPILNALDPIARQATDIIDPAVPPKPLIGIVGEIYLRSHTASNQDLIKLLESHGAEVVNASLAEWFNYIPYRLAKTARRNAAYDLRRWKLGSVYRQLRKWLRHRTELAYQYLRMDQVYGRVTKHLSIHEDHRMRHVESRLNGDTVYSFRLGTEAPLSIGGALEYGLAGFDGVVNVFPFGCMPSTMSSAILRPIMEQLQIPYVDSVYDGTVQPNREAMIRTFMYQATEHQEARLSQRAPGQRRA
jgi:predicted nucleotide-binding protein (sugar kinase/HSP70/actin superfamily)